MDFALTAQGLSVKIAFMLQLNIENGIENDQTKSNYLIGSETGRRCMWRCYVDDVLTSIGGKGPRLIQDDDMKIRIPISSSVVFLNGQSYF